MSHLEQSRLQGPCAGRGQSGVDDRDDGNRQRRRLHHCLELGCERQCREGRCLRLIEQRDHVFTGSNPSEGAQYLSRRFDLDVRR